MANSMGKYPNTATPFSSDFEFTVSLSPNSKTPSHLCPADQLFYKGHLLPLHPTPRLDMASLLLFSSPRSSSFSDSTITSSSSSRDSTRSSVDSTSAFFADLALSSECNFSSRTSSAVEDEHLKKQEKEQPRKEKLFSLSFFSCVVRPLYEMLSWTKGGVAEWERSQEGRTDLSFPSSMRSSPTRAELYSRMPNRDTSLEEEEWEKAIQGAIAHCKNSMAKD